MLSLLLIQVSISVAAQEQQREATTAVVNPVLRSNFSQTISLDGQWDFAVDPQKKGQDQQWYRSDVPLPNKRHIQVPGCWEAQGVGEPGYSQPHEIRMTFGINRPIFATYTGSAWYRKTITLPTKWKDNKIWLKIGGINSIGWIWVNGRFVAKHYEYAGTYKYDISDLVATGQSATVAVLVRNDIPSRQGLSQCVRTYGGLYRSVELEATPSVFVDYAYVQGDIDTQSAAVHATIRSAASKRRRVKVEVKLSTIKGEKAGKASKLVTVDPGSTTEVVIDIPLKTFQAWSPEHPNLYRADIVLKKGGKAVHGWIERFGVKKFEARNKRFWLNNKPYFLRGYGEDHTYPLTVCSPADRKTHLANLSRAKDYGFNFVRQHTHVELPEYFEVADELGIMVQSELPYWALPGIWPTAPNAPFWSLPGSSPNEYGIAHMSNGHVDPLGDLRTLIKHYRGHVSLAIYGGGNEGRYSNTLGRKLYDLAKELDPSRPWISQDGATDEYHSPWIAHYDGKEKGYSPSGAQNDGTEKDPLISDLDWGLTLQLSESDMQLSDLQSYSRVGSGDSFQVPILEKEDRWPMLQHEFQCLNSGSDARLEPKFRNGYAPMHKLTRAQAFARSAGLDWQWGQDCIKAGLRLQSIFQKIGFESARLDPRLDGYTLFLLVDFTYAQIGVLDMFYERKYSTADYFRAFNQPVVLLARDPDPKPGLFLSKTYALPPEYEFDEAAIKKRMKAHPAKMRPIPNAFYDWPVYTSGQAVPVEWVISNFGDTAISNEKLTWRLLDNGKVMADGTSSDVDAPVGDVAKVGQAEITLPQVTKPLKATAKVSLTGGQWSNSWDLWVFPSLSERQLLPEPVAVSEDLYELLSQRYKNVVPVGAAEAANAKVLITDDGGDSMVKALEQGKKVLCLGVPTEGRMKVGTWLGNWVSQKQAGTAIAAGHPAFGDFPNEGFMNQPWFRLMDLTLKLTPDSPVKQADMLMAGRGSKGYFTCVFQARSGKGSVLVSGLDLTRKTRNMPESAYLLDQMIRYVTSGDFSPDGTVDPEIFQKPFNPAKVLKKLNGFAEFLKGGSSTTYNSGIYGTLQGYLIRQTDGKGMLTWRTKPLTEENINTDSEAIFKWPATTGWFGDPAGGHFTLLVNGKELLKFDVSFKITTWQAPDKRGTLTYDFKGFTNPDHTDSVGIMTLTLPAGTVKIGESIEIAVKGSASSSRRFFMLYEIL